MHLRAPRVVRSVRRRPAAFVALVVLAAFAVTVSALTPMLLSAVAAHVLRDRVAALGPPDDGILAVATAPSAAVVPNASGAVLEAMNAIGTSGLWRPAVTSTATAESYTWTAGSLRTSQLAIASGLCQGVRIVRGTCPSSIGQAAVPASVAAASPVRIGAVLAVRSADHREIDPRVVGVYDDASGAGARLADLRGLTGGDFPHSAPNLLLGEGRLEEFPFGLQVVGLRELARPVAPSDVAAIRAAVDAAGLAVQGGDGAASSGTVTSALPTLLDSLQAQQDAAASLTAPIALEALVLAWFALAHVGRRTARARAGEWGIGRMRGLRRRSRLADVLLEPVAAILLGSLLGAAVAVLAAGAVARAVLGRGAAVDPLEPVAIAAAVLALVGSLVALVGASARSALLPLDALLRETTEPRRLSRGALAAQLGVVLLTAAALWTVLTTAAGTGPQLSLLLPALIALLVGIAASRLTVLLVRRTAGRPPRSLTGLVVARGLARAPSVLGAAVLVLVGAALVAYSLQLAAVSERVQDDRAALAVGAATVLQVRVPRTVSLLDAVRRADPTGRSALAAEERDLPGATGTGRVVAVDAARLAAVGAWRPEWRGGARIGALPGPAPRDLRLTGRRLEVTVQDVAPGATEGPPEQGYLAVSAVLDIGSRWRTVELGALRDGVLRAGVPCSSGCRLVSLGVRLRGTVQPEPWGATFTIAGIATDVEPAARTAAWLRGDRWRNRIADEADPSVPGTATATTSAGGLALDAEDGSGDAIADVEPASGPAVLPAVTAEATSRSAFPGRRGDVFGTDLAGAPLLLHLTGAAEALPRSLRSGVLVDLAALHRLTDPSLDTGVQEVWLAAGAPDRVVAALRADGVRVLGTRTTAAAQAAAARGTVPLAVSLARATAGAAVALVVIALLAAWIVDAPERRHDRRALRLAGIPPGRLRRLAAVRFGAPAAVAALLGVPTGALAFAVTADRLPLLAGVSPGPPLALAPPLLLLAATAVALVLLVAVVTAVVAALEPGEARR